MSVPLTLLIVDDNPLYRHLAFMGVRGVDEMPVVPVFAANTDEAVERFREDKPQMVFLDINLPGSGDGLDLLDAFLGIDPEAYVVMMTSQGDFETVQRARDAGAHGYILKPFNAQKLTDALLGYRTFCDGGKPSKRREGYVPVPRESVQVPVSMTKESVVGLQSIMANWHVVCVGQEQGGVSVALGELDCRVSRFENGYAAWSFLEKNPADILILDAFLPDMDGFVLAEQVHLMMKKKPFDTHVIAVFETPELVNASRMTLAGVKMYFTKPVQAEQVEGQLRDYAAAYNGLVRERFER